ncbi:hypothetical protein HanRHA438_Chr02g0067291 [Helianthus annuus]|nr:hypothetical protein HanRHA438_Chr02g0067291 [Helianthus annuus]
MLSPLHSFSLPSKATTPNNLKTFQRNKFEHPFGRFDTKKEISFFIMLPLLPNSFFFFSHDISFPSSARSINIFEGNVILYV